MTLDADAILDQRQSPGLIENACRNMLIRLAGEVPNDQAVVELGAYMGRSTGHLALGAQQGNGAPVWSVDPWELADEPDAAYLATARSVVQYRAIETRETYERHLEQTGARPFVTTVQATAVDAVAAYDGPPVALLFHDALHRLEDVRDDLTAWVPHMADEAVIVLHDVGDPQFAVDAGAAEVLADDGRWDWAGREVHLWAKQPNRRGYLLVRTT